MEQLELREPKSRGSEVGAWGQKPGGRGQEVGGRGRGQEVKRGGGIGQITQMVSLLKKEQEKNPGFSQRAKKNHWNI